MHRTNSRLTLAAWLALSISAVCGGASPPSDDGAPSGVERLDDAAPSFDQVLDDMLSRFDRVERDRSLTKEQAIDALTRIREEGLAAIDYNALTVDQLQRLTSYRFFTGIRGAEGGTDFTPRVIARLRPLSAEPSEAGAVAAILLARVGASAKSESAPTDAVAALTHSHTPALLRDSRGGSVFRTCITALRAPSTDDGAPAGVVAVRTLLDSIPADFDANNLTQSDELYEALLQHDHPAARELAEPLRQRLLGLGRSRLPAVVEDQRWWVELRLAFLEYAPTRVRLVNGAAPDVPLLWWSDDRVPVHALSDLRGQIVVLDFWSSTCGFCHGAHRVRDKLVREMAGEPVRFVALAAREPTFVLALDPREEIPTPSLDDEIAATKRYVGMHDLAETFAIADWANYKPQYGVRGTPATIVIDHRGIVRAVGHDPRTPDPTVELLRTILAERASDACP